MISSAMLGGGIGPARWVLNAQVAGAYSRTDPVAHLTELAASHGLDGPGVGMLTAASVSAPCGGTTRACTCRRRSGCASRPGRPPRRNPRPGARTAGRQAPPAWTPGTINIVVAVPVPLSDAALVNAVVTATEAKTQALLEAGFRARAPRPTPSAWRPPPTGSKRSSRGLARSGAHGSPAPSTRPSTPEPSTTRDTSATSTGRRTTPVRYDGRFQGQCSVGLGLTSYLCVAPPAWRSAGVGRRCPLRG